MSPVTHLFASGVVAAYTTDNLRDRRLVTIAGVIPDADGLGIIFDIANGSFSHGNLFYYPKYHHWILHGLPGALLCSFLLAAFAQRKWRVLGLAFLVFHLHLLCDFVGSRGPTPDDIWPIFYLGPFSQTPMWYWKHQWALDAWPNRIFSAVLLFWSLALAVRLGDSIVGVFSRRADEVVVAVLRRWAAAARARWAKAPA